MIIGVSTCDWSLWEDFNVLSRCLVYSADGWLLRNLPNTLGYIDLRGAVPGSSLDLCTAGVSPVA